MNGAALIAKERKRQQEAEGYDWRHDDMHDGGEIACAAAVYALPVKFRRIEVWGVALWRRLQPVHWHFKGTIATQTTTGEPDTATRIRELVKAGALVAAEIDRLQRLQRRGRGAR